jgi:hypothetical protein
MEPGKLRYGWRKLARRFQITAIGRPFLFPEL